MVLKIADFRLHPSLRKTVRKFARAANCQVRVDFAFEQVIIGCATTARDGQPGTWILPEMVKVYLAFHRAGFAHSVETWVNDELVGGLYFVAIGQAVFGESMFHRVTDGSKIALVALACMCRHFNIDQIDCQQNTRHLASFGACKSAETFFPKRSSNEYRFPGQIGISRRLAGTQWPRRNHHEMTTCANPDHSELEYYIIAVYPCSYINGQTARSQVAAPSEVIDATAYNALIQQGFRRSGPFSNT